MQKSHHQWLVDSLHIHSQPSQYLTNKCMQLPSLQCLVIVIVIVVNTAPLMNTQAWTRHPWSLGKLLTCIFSIMHSILGQNFIMHYNNFNCNWHAWQPSLSLDVRQASGGYFCLWWWNLVYKMFCPLTHSNISNVVYQIELVLNQIVMFSQMVTSTILVTLQHRLQW